MRRAQGYAVLIDPDHGVQEWDTYTCAHCQRIVPVQPRQDPATLGGFCRGCMGHICAPCAVPGTCEVFERKLDHYERAHRLHQAMGLVLKTFVVVSLLWAHAAMAAELQITWVDNATDETSYELERGSEVAGPFSNIATLAADVTTYRDTNLTPDTQYCYRVRACNANGCSAYSADSGSMCQRTRPLPSGGGVIMSGGFECGCG